MKKYIFPFVLIIIGIFAARYLLIPGLMQTHDGIWHIERTLGMTKMLRAGNFPVRWVSDLDNGYGLPVFNYVYPLPYYLSSILTILGVGVVASYKLVTLIFFFSGALGFYYLFRRRPLIGLGAGILYLLSPYVMLDVFVRGAYGEVVALGIVPWLMVSMRELIDSGKLRWYSPIPLFLILIAHNFLGLMILGLIVGYLIFFVTPTHRRRVIISTLFSIGLAAFFLIPMIGERGLLMSAPEGLANADFARHYVYPSQLLYGRWNYSGSLPGLDSTEISYQLGLGTLLVILVSIFALREIWLLVALVFFSVFMTTYLSSFIWDALPILQIIQFPWRLLFIPAIFAPVLFGVITSKMRSGKQKIFVAICMSLSLIGIVSHSRPERMLSDQEFANLHAAYNTKFASAYRYELTPYWADIERDQGELVAVTSGGAVVSNVATTPTTVAFDVVSDGNGELRIARNYFPSWRGKIDGRAIDLSPSIDGSISVPIETGVHHYRLNVSSTPIEIIGNLVSLLAVGIVILVVRKQE